MQVKNKFILLKKQNFKIQEIKIENFEGIKVTTMNLETSLYIIVPFPPLHICL